MSQKAVNYRKIEAILCFNMRGVERIVSACFSIAFTNREILSLLESQRSIAVAIRTLKRRLGLFRRKFLVVTHTYYFM